MVAALAKAHYLRVVADLEALLGLPGPHSCIQPALSYILESILLFNLYYSSIYIFMV